MTDQNNSEQHNKKPHQTVYTTGPQTDNILTEAKRCDRILRDLNMAVSRGEMPMKEYYKNMTEIDSAVTHLRANLSEVRKNVRQTGRKRTRPASKKKAKKSQVIKSADQLPKGSAAAKQAPKDEPISVPGTKRVVVNTKKKEKSA